MLLAWRGQLILQCFILFVHAVLPEASEGGEARARSHHDDRGSGVFRQVEAGSSEVSEGGGKGQMGDGLGSVGAWHTATQGAISLYPLHPLC